MTAKITTTNDSPNTQHPPPMALDYINLNFSSVDDLQEIDAKIAELEALAQTIQTAADAKVGDHAVTVPVAKNEPLQAAAEELAAEVARSVEFGDLLAVESLIQRYNIPRLHNIHGLIQRNHALAQDIELIREARDIELSLKSTEVDLSAVSLRINALDTSHTSPEIHREVSSLTGQLLQQINSKRIALEPKLKQLLPADWLELDFTPLLQSSPEFASIATSAAELLHLQSIIPPQYPETWWALDILLEPVVTRFHYHFSGSRETNKLAKPEWALNFVETFLTETLDFLSTIVKRPFVQTGRIAEYEIITSILVPVREKCLASMKSINDSIAKYKDDHANNERSGRLLSHLIFEVSSFDQRIRSFYQYNPYIQNLEVPSEKWTGITGDILIGNENVGVSNWLQFEHDLANKRFISEILETKNAFKIDYDYQTTDADHIFKPTYSAYNLVKLFDNLTTHFQTLGIVKYQLKYVSSIQLNLVQQYCEALNKQFKKFAETYQQSVLSLIPGGINDDTSVKSNIDALELLTSVYSLAKYVYGALEEWSVELIFIQLWNSFKTISTKIQSDDSIFGNALKQYDSLIGQVHLKYEDFFRREIRVSLKNYVNSSRWDLGNVDTSEPSNDLSHLVNNLPVYLSFLQRSLPGLDYLYLSDKIVSIVSTILIEYIITNNRFTKTGVLKLETDFQYIVSNVQGFLYLNGDNLENREYKRLVGSIEVLRRVDAVTAKSFVNRDKKVLREMFGTFEGVSDGELNDLCMRIR